MIPLLELPELGRMARSHTVYGETALSARAAVALLDGPFGEHAMKATTPASVIQLVLRGWLHSFTEHPAADKQAGTLAEVFASRQIGYDLVASYTERNEETDSEEAFMVALHCKPRNHNVHAIGARLKQAEQLRGLGQSALVALSHAADASIPIMHPPTLAQICAGRKYLQNHLNSYPRWVLDPQPLERRTLESLANPHRTRFTGRLARAILAVEDAVAAARNLKLPKRLSCTEFPLAVTWEPVLNWNSGYMQIMDDWRHRIGEKRTEIFRFEYEPGAGKRFAPALAKFMTSIASTGPILRAAWALVGELRKGKKDDD